MSLWDIRIKTESTVDRAKVFTAFRNYWRRLFQRYLYLDFLATIREEFGENWFNDPTLNDLRMVSIRSWATYFLGQRMLCFTPTTRISPNILISGSKTFYFRFPVFHRKMIRDRAKLFFEKPGPTLTPRQLERAQPAFSDPTAKEEVRKKVFKVKN